jgi:hypothetical protein
MTDPYAPNTSPFDLKKRTFRTVFKRPEADAIRFFGRRVIERNIRNMQRHFLFDDAADDALDRIRLDMLLDAIDPFDEDMLGVGTAQNGAALSLVFAGDDDHVVALTNLFHDLPYSTSGASETIFMNRSPRSSRVTGPKIRVPIGSILLFRSTAALWSNLTSDPSRRRTPLAVRTTTAL